jgi:hypothetical protein
VARADDDMVEPSPTEPAPESEPEQPTDAEDDASVAARDLSQLEPPGRWQRQVALVVMVLTAVGCLLMAWSLAGRAAYTFRARKPLELGSLGTVTLGGEHANRYVRAVAPLEERPVVRYRRLGEPGYAVLAKVAGRGEIWVEHELPERAAGPRFVTPTRFAGRLVRLSDLGAGYWGVAGTVAEALGNRAPSDVWVLVDGATPESERWAFALALLMAVFGAWNLLGVFFVTRRLPAD